MRNYIRDNVDKGNLGLVLRLRYVHMLKSEVEILRKMYKNKKTLLDHGRFQQVVKEALDKFGGGTCYAEIWA